MIYLHACVITAELAINSPILITHSTYGDQPPVSWHEADAFH